MAEMESLLIVEIWKAGAQEAIAKLLLGMPPPTKVSVSQGERTVDIKLEIEIEDITSL